MRISYSMLSWRTHEDFSILRQSWRIFWFHDDTRSDHGISYFYIGWRILEDRACFVSCSMAVGVDVVQIFFYLWRMYDIFYSGLVTRTRIATRAFFYITMIVVGIFLHYDGWREKFYATSFLLRGDTNAWVSYSGSYSGFFRLIPGGYYGGRFLTLWRVTWMYASWGIFYFIDIDVCVVQIFYSVAKHTWPDHENFLFYASCTRGLYHEDFVAMIMGISYSVDVL